MTLTPRSFGYWIIALGMVFGGDLAKAALPVAADGAGSETIHCELAVIGGGSGGFGAALAAARMKLDVVLVEHADRLGGNSVGGGVHCWEPGVGGTGIPFDLYLRFKRIPDAVGIYSFGRHASTLDPKRESYRYPGGETVIDPSRRYLDSLLRHGSAGLRPAEALAFRRERLHGVVCEPGAMARTMRAMLEETGQVQPKPTWANWKRCWCYRSW